MARGRRLSVWDILQKLGHPLHGGDSALRVGCPDDRDLAIQHVFETVGSMLLPSPDGGGPLRGGGVAFDGDEFLVETFRRLGGTKDWPACGSEEWSRLREVALRRVVARLAREGLLDAIAVAVPTRNSIRVEFGTPGCVID